MMPGSPSTSSERFSSLADVAWPADRLGEAVEALGRESGLSMARRGSLRGSCPLARSGLPVDGDSDGALALERWLEIVAAELGLEAEPVDAAYGEAERMVTGLAPGLLRLPGTRPLFLAVLRSRRGRGGRLGKISVLAPDLKVRKVASEAALEALQAPVAAGVGGEVERTLERAGVPARRAAGAREAILRRLLPSARISGAWCIRPLVSGGTEVSESTARCGSSAISGSPGLSESSDGTSGLAGWGGLAALAREARLVRLFLAHVSCHLGLCVLWIVSWWLLGRAALEGRLDRGWLVGWGLLLLTLVPIHLVSTYAGGLLSIRAGAILKRRLLRGALALEPEAVRHMGAGQLLGRVLEADVAEQMGISGGFLAITGVIEVLLSAFVLSRGAGGWLHVALLSAWLIAAVALALRYLRRRAAWTERRLAMTNDVVEGMVGHRTRLAQEVPERRSEEEDRALEGYVAASRGLDDEAARVFALLPRGWFILGILGLVPAFVAGTGAPGALAVALGGVLLGTQAFRHLSDGVERGAAAAVAWRYGMPFWEAAARAEPQGHPAVAAAAGDARAVRREAPAGNDGSPASGSADGRATLLDLRDVAFRYPGRAEPVLKGLHLRIRAGDRVLLEGPSGGGKSTLAATIAGVRPPGAGLILLRGLDRETLGRNGWRRRVVLVPQFHENHVFLGTLAFNALVGRGWPPAPQDLEEASRVCRGLGLGPLIDRMPAGLMQLVGETGWQLSHGERSRLYVARALLQGADVIILDESFAALDPETLRTTMRFVLERVPTLVVIAHP